MAFHKDKNGLIPGRMRVLAGGLLLFSMGILFGALAGETISTQKKPEATENEEMVFPENTAVQMAAAVKDTTVVEWITFFPFCGHECVMSDTESAVGMTMEDLAETYKDYEVRLFTDARVKLKREIPGWCPEHFVLMTEEGDICVKKTDAETLLPYKVVTLSASPDMFSEEERKNLETGMPFDSLAEIDAFFEGIDS
ncbi:MAG: hypothetical protein E7330_06415 [Clostridiales bacterium]|nr:hypothetical protein [Clostridiales bacterium]